MSPWLPVIISGLMGVVTVAANLVLLGRWSGTTSAAINNLVSANSRLEKRVNDLEGGVEKRVSDLAEAVGRRVSAFEEEVEGQAALRSEFSNRLQATEKMAETFWAVRDQITAMRAAGEVEQRYSRETLDRLTREVGGIHRAIANMTSGNKSPIREFGVEA